MRREARREARLPGKASKDGERDGDGRIRVAAAAREGTGVSSDEHKNRIRRERRTRYRRRCLREEGARVRKSDDEEKRREGTHRARS